MFQSREMVQRLAFGLSFLQRMDMKPVVIMGWSEHEDLSPSKPLAGSPCTQGLVKRSKQLTEALQQHSVVVLPLFSAESFLLLQEPQTGTRWVGTIHELQQEQKHMRDSCARKNLSKILLRARKWRHVPCLSSILHAPKNKQTKPTFLGSYVVFRSPAFIYSGFNYCFNVFFMIYLNK